MRGIAAALIPLNRLKPFEGCRLRVLSASATRRLRRSVRKGSLDIPQEDAHSAFYRRPVSSWASLAERRIALPPAKEESPMRHLPDLSLFRIISSMTCTRPSTWSVRSGQRAAMRAGLVEIPSRKAVCVQCMDAFSANHLANKSLREEERTERIAAMISVNGYACCLRLLSVRLESSSMS
jgi:hypothetical protein